MSFDGTLMRGRPSGANGFSLLELLVVMSLLVLLVLAMGSTFRGVAMTETRIDQRIEEQNDFRSISHFLKVVMSRVVDRAVARPLAAETDATQFFSGETNGLAWLGVMPARHGAAGLHFFRLQAEPHGDRSALVLRYLPERGQKTWPEWAGAPARVLVPGITEFVVGYEDIRHAPFQWQPHWSSRDRLPDRVRLVMQTDTGRSWVLVMSVRPLLGRSDDGSFGVGGNP